MEFLATNRRCEKPNWLIVLGSTLGSSTFAELKGHEHVANAVTVANPGEGTLGISGWGCAAEPWSP